MDNRGGFHGYRKQQQLPKPASAAAAGLTATDRVNNHISGAANGGRAVAEVINHSACSNHNISNNNSNGNNGSNSSNNHPTDHGMSNNECIVREQDRFMPIANVIRIMRKILPPHAKISDDAKETIQECVSEYISFITGEANERCQREQRKTITAEDVLWAMSILGFDDHIEPLTLYLHRYRELEGDRGSIRTCEPLLKMSRAAMDQYAAFGPVFHIGPPHHAHHALHHPHPHPGYFGAPPSSVNGYLKEHSASASASDTAANSQSPAIAAASSGASAATFEPYGQPAK